MIKRISQIKNFGIYTDFRWSAETRDFNDKNIIYGWNYSGKTTLSRLFKILANKDELGEENNDMEFTIQLDEGNTITHINRKDNPLDIVVFNSDYIRDNLHFESSDPKIRGIFFDIGEESADTREKLINVQKQIDDINKWLLQNHQHVDDFAKFEDLFTTEAKKIKNEHFESSIEFNKGHLKRILGSFDVKSFQSHIITDQQELNETRANALAKEPLAKIEDTRPIISLKSILKDIQSCLSTEPSMLKDDTILSSNSDLYSWVKQGKEIYKQYPQIHTCAFCGNIITNDRQKFLNAYYNNEAAKLRDTISILLQRLEEERLIVCKNTYLSHSPNDFIESCKTDFKDKQSQYDRLKDSYLNELNLCEASLLNKLNHNLFLAQDPPKINISAEEDLNKWIEQVHNIIVKHNKTVSDFQTIKSEAIGKFKKHLVAKLLSEKKYYTIKSQMEKQEAEIKEHKEILQAKLNQSQELLSKLKSIVKGQENLNQFIQIFLNRKDISVEVSENDYFVFKRRGNVAKNLSEGEKSAIAFSYFMVTLESLLEEGRLYNTIVFIDDPISSLDANHIAQLSSLINSFFFRKDNQGKVINYFKQLFISTHNFEFYSFLRDANNIRRKKKVQNKEVPSCNFYMLKRVGESNTQLINLPKSFSNYNSEYLFLFDEICEFKANGYPEDRAYIMPNVIRRFLEIYTLIKLPGNRDEIDNRIKLLVGDVNELKILHHFSHFTSPERITKHSELILKIPDLVEDTFVLLAKDDIHYKSLLTGVGRQL